LSLFHTTIKACVSHHHHQLQYLEYQVSVVLVDNIALIAVLYLVLDEKELIMNANHGVFRKEKRAGKNICRNLSYSV